MEGQTQDDNNNRPQKKSLAHRGWNEAKTIIIGSLVFVAAFQWRDLIQHLLKNIEKRMGTGNFPKTLIMFLIAVAVTLLCVVIVCVSKEEITSTRLARMSLDRMHQQLESFRTYN